jgi:hypothetical protein
MSRPKDCNCQCGIESTLRYTCYNGFCVRDDLGEYTEPTCNTDCPVPTTYSCISGYCIPTVGGTYNNPICNSVCPPMPPKRYSCLSSVCTQVRGGSYYEPTCSGVCAPRSADYACLGSICTRSPGGPYKNNPTCGGACNIVIDFRYDCVNGQCVQTPNGIYINDSNCGGNCPNPSGRRYKCQDGQCVEAIDGTYINDPTCNNDCVPSSGNYLLVNCQDENETIVATAPSGAYKQPYGGVWKIDGDCWKMVGEIECPCVPPPIVLPDTRTAGCDSCNNGVCCFEVIECSYTGDPINFECVDGQCLPDANGQYILDPTCGGNANCGSYYWKICVSGMNATSCADSIGKIIKIDNCDDPLVIGDSGPPCSPSPNPALGCQCCFTVINSIPEEPEYTRHNLINIYNNCCECNPCGEQVNDCLPGETWISNCSQCGCFCLDPPCGSEPPEEGACCDVSCDAISCSITTQENCPEGSTWYGGETCSVCTPEPCNPQTGECCGGYECIANVCTPVQFGVSLEECQLTCQDIEE